MGALVTLRISVWRLGSGSPNGKACYRGVPQWWASFFTTVHPTLTQLRIDPPIKRFAQRHNYLSTDAIASRDLGFGVARQGVGSSSSSGSIGRSDTLTSLTSATQSSPNIPSERKRPSSPPDKRRDDKRQRGNSPLRDRGDRRDGPPSRRRFNSPPRERERDWDNSRGRTEREEEKPSEKPVVVPPIVSWFVGTLPDPASFDGSYAHFNCHLFTEKPCRIGPVFRTNDLMQLFRDAVIPSSTAAPRKESPAPPAARGGRPPPDYSPYQGPGSTPSTRGRRW